jgi:hypothetical protein
MPTTYLRIGATLCLQWIRSLRQKTHYYLPTYEKGNLWPNICFVINIFHKMVKSRHKFIVLELGEPSCCAPCYTEVTIVFLFK